MAENIDYGDTDLRAIIEGERHNRREESFSDYGYQEQEFKNNELVTVDEEEAADDYIEEADDEEIFLDDSADDEDEE